MRKIPWGLSLIFFIMIAMIMVGGTSVKEKKSIVAEELIEEDIEKRSTAKEEEVETKWNNPLNRVKLMDNKQIYHEDDDTHVDKIYVTVLPPSNKEAVSFEELNKNINNANVNNTEDDIDPVAEIIFEKDISKEEINFNQKPNATIEIRGQSSRLADQKSYKIKLFDTTEAWFDFKIINLNKHYPDSLRIRNKLSFDYFEMIPDFMSLRTRFVRLYIKDLSSKNSDNNFKDYGLYTFIEQPNKRFLKRHNLDPNGNLYKAENFEFFRYPDNIKAIEDMTYDKKKFEEILEVYGNDDHKKIIATLDAVNGYNKNINETIDQYFDKDNLLTWLAVNILFDNYDTNSRNFLLYSPLNSKTIFFMPWDYDGAWTQKKKREKWEKGISNYWGMVLFNKFFKAKDNIDALSKKIEDLSNIINEKNTRKFLDSYYKVVKENVLIPPDINYLRTTANEYEQEYNALPSYTEKNKKYYYESLENPMPFFLQESIYENGKYKFLWQPSYDLQHDEVSYNFILSRDEQFNHVVATYKNLRSISCVVEDLMPGDYYWKVIAIDAKGNWQVSFHQFLKLTVKNKQKGESSMDEKEIK